MLRSLGLSAVALLGCTAVAWGAGPCGKCTPHCIQPPPPTCPDCSCPCDKGLHWCAPWYAAKACKLTEQLAQGNCCERIKAAEKLGSRLHADWCCNREVLTALNQALVCDPCWEVRRAAAWSLARQNARTGEAVLALHVASKLDPHYLVRDKAATALDVLLVCRRECFKELLATGDELVKQLRGKYKPGSPECSACFAQCCEVSVVTGPAVPPAEKPK